MKTLENVYSLITSRLDYDNETDFFGGDCVGLYAIGYTAVSIYESGDAITVRILTPLDVKTFTGDRSSDFTAAYDMIDGLEA
ncbi:hypothetical protein PQ472_07810 [Lacticaseibacillus pabuli]|uniref:Uncharacterized protein n=1 Tax=Lacticaseibacillus pabuli TaxID=3025672 RepID=A0ABY7WRT2_9LACO|nr:hypothetical protein [Lacticaseibacillus sp. KACC 23028]WDF81830.1 hypothetical protein PQ472_07810 [Lacticaseibacillus sp. KACC 23028]